MDIDEYDFQRGRLHQKAINQSLSLRMMKRNEKNTGKISSSSTKGERFNETLIAFRMVTY